MPSYQKSTFKAGLAPIWRGIVRASLGKRTLGAWTAVVFARLKDLAPYAVIELLLPGGSVLALARVVRLSDKHHSGTAHRFYQSGSGLAYGIDLQTRC